MILLCEKNRGGYRARFGKNILDYSCNRESSPTSQKDSGERLECRPWSRCFTAAMARWDKLCGVCGEEVERRLLWGFLERCCVGRMKVVALWFGHGEG